MDEAGKSRVFPQAGVTATWAHRLGSFLSAEAWTRPPATALDALLARAVLACGGSSGSVFVLEPGGHWLRDALGIWDWTRTSFRVWLEHWPTVSRALAADRAIHLGPHRSEGAESDWFREDGIHSCIAAPMVGRSGALGVLFVDFAHGQSVDPARALERAHSVAKDWAHAIEAACDFELRATEPELTRGVSSLHSDTPVRMIMTPAPVLIGVNAVARVATRLAKTRGVHHLLAVEGEILRGVLCRCDLDAARPGAIVAEVMHAPVVSVSADVTIAHAARVVREQAVGCLPVFDAGGRMVGLVTRRDLRSAGALSFERGFDACATCGSTHGLNAPCGVAPVFCAECVRAPLASESSVEALYQTLGGSG